MAAYKKLPDDASDSLNQYRQYLVFPDDKDIVTLDGQEAGFVMPQVIDGIELEDYLTLHQQETATPPITIEHMHDLAEKLANTVKYLHKNGWTLCDLNPKNILITRDPSNGGLIPHIIDPDMMQKLPAWPGRSVNPMIRDLRVPVGTFNEETDNFSLAVVTFWMMRNPSV